MAISLQVVLTKLSEKTTWSDEAIEKIDEELSNPRTVVNRVMNQATNPTWQFMIEGIATPGDKEHLIREYENAGWGNVVVINSDERNSITRIVNVLLSQHKIEPEPAPMRRYLITTNNKDL